MLNQAYESKTCKIIFFSVLDEIQYSNFAFERRPFLTKLRIILSRCVMLNTPRFSPCDLIFLVAIIIKVVF